MARASQTTAVGDDHHNVLVLAPTTTNTASLGAEVMAVADPSFVVHVTDEPYEQLQCWHVDRPSNCMVAVHVVDLDGSIRPGYLEQSTPIDHLDSFAVERRTTVTQTESATVEKLSEWHDRPGRIVLVVNSLSPLLRFGNRRAVFSFLISVRKCVSRCGVIALFHLAPDEHDERTVTVIQSMFETVVQPSSDHDRTPLKPITA